MYQTVDFFLLLNTPVNTKINVATDSIKYHAYILNFTRNAKFVHSSKPPNGTPHTPAANSASHAPTAPEHLSTILGIEINHPESRKRLNKMGEKNRSRLIQYCRLLSKFRKVKSVGLIPLVHTNVSHVYRGVLYGYPFSQLRPQSERLSTL